MYIEKKLLLYFFFFLCSQNCWSQKDGIKIQYYGTGSRSEQLASDKPVKWAEIYSGEIGLLNNQARVENLKHLEIRNRSFDWAITDTLPESLWKLENLEYLKLNWLNNLQWKTIIPRLAKLPHLKTLVISFCGDSFLIPEIKLLHQLEELDISACQAKRLPDELFTLTNLKSLSLTACGLKDSLTSKIALLYRLEKLDVSFGSLKTLPNSLIQLENLKELIAEGNEFKKIPGVIGRMKQLEKISFADNKIGEIKEDLFLVSGLRYIDFSHNRIHKISCGIEKLSLLNYLDISVNRLHELPAGLLGCDSLAEMYCANNHFQRQPVVLKLLILSCKLRDKSEQLSDSMAFYSEHIHFDCAESSFSFNNLKPRKKFIQDMETEYPDCYESTPGMIGGMSCDLAYSFDYKRKDECLEIYGWLPLYYRKNPAYKMARYLDMTIYDLPVLPVGYRRLTNLTEAEITRNEIWIGVRRVVRPLKRCDNMQKLSLTDGLLKHLPHSIHKMKKLKYLELNCPQMKSLPGWLANLPDLKEIKVHGNIEVPDAIIRKGIRVTRI